MLPVTSYILPQNELQKIIRKCEKKYQYAPKKERLYEYEIAEINIDKEAEELIRKEKERLQIRYCEKCGIQIKKTTYYENISRRRFCSKACARSVQFGIAKPRKPKQQKNCEYCKKTFVQGEFCKGVRWENRKYCSVQCAGKAKQKESKGEIKWGQLNTEKWKNQLQIK